MRLRGQITRFLSSKATRNPSYDHLEVVRFGPGEFSSKLVSQRAFGKGEEIVTLEGFTKGAEKRWSTVQIEEDQHIELNPESGLVYMNHSCSPSVFVDTTNLRIVALKDLSPGSELTFFYPSTEWEMAQPFKCWCNAPDCVGVVGGAHALGEKALSKFKVNPHITKLINKARQG
ncbi:hypothetical protein HDU67_001430 [Dinochytrium kinnereticum]|nr:hypothetical protein HDU67_001430 [Dinochytrium kinnereticum]